MAYGAGQSRELGGGLERLRLDVVGYAYAYRRPFGGVGDAGRLWRVLGHDEAVVRPEVSVFAFGEKGAARQALHDGGVFQREGLQPDCPVDECVAV